MKTIGATTRGDTVPFDARWLIFPVYDGSSDPDNPLGPHDTDSMHLAVVEDAYQLLKEFKTEDPPDVTVALFSPKGMTLQEEAEISRLVLAFLQQLMKKHSKLTIAPTVQLLKQMRVTVISVSASVTGLINICMPNTTGYY